MEQELVQLGRSVQDLAGRPKGDARKVRIAERLRRETTMTLRWIAERLYMGAPGHVSCLLYRKEINQKQAEREKSENKWFYPARVSLETNPPSPALPSVPALPPPAHLCREGERLRGLLGARGTLKGEHQAPHGAKNKNCCQ